MTAPSGPVFVATKNVGKLRELRAIFAHYDWQLQTFEAYADPIEGVESYAQNAAAKARALRGQLRAAGIAAAILGDDSGLEVHVLGGRPGVLSARYAGPTAGWDERRRKLLAEVDERGADRRAAFVCALHYIAVDGTQTAVIRRLEGEIAIEERGSAGFSYDPIFTYLPLAATFGELDEATKNRISHRALAARALVTDILAKAVSLQSQNERGSGRSSAW